MKQAQALKHDVRGNVAVMFGIALVPLMLFAGAAVDYTRASATRTQLQAAVDATALATARQASTNYTSGRSLETYARNYFRANFNPDMPVNLKELAIQRSSDTVIVSASGRMETTLLGAVSFKSMDLGARAEVGVGTANLEVALVLDTTGSMDSSGKMAAMQRAAKDLLNTLEDTSRSAGGSVRASIVPFNTEVRVDPNLRNAPWLYFAGVSPADWNGCISDREQPYDTSLAQARNDSATGYWAVPCSWSNRGPARLRPLTSDFSSLRQTIDSLTPAGNTNITIGAMWGLAALSSTGPIGNAAPKGARAPQKIMIILTDGDNTQNRTNGYQANGNTAVDARTRAACASIKNEGIKVYTIRVLDGNETLLRDCASRPDMYYNVENARDLIPAFRGIAQEIAALRLAK